MRMNLKQIGLSLLMTIGCLTMSGNVVRAQVSTAKPWTYWWWMGNAVNDKDLIHSLQQFKNVGIGGVHIIPIYGVKGYESQFQPFLGPKYMKSLAVVLAEAKKLGLGVDMTTGTGWPFGGPNVSEAASAEKWVYKNGEFTGVSTMQKVKRAAPGGEGHVYDPYDPQLMRKYLERFDSAFANKNLSNLRSMYNDSYEVYGANWTHNFLNEFKKRRGYDLRTVAKIFVDSANYGQESKLIKMDYQQTLSELLYETSRVWTQWSAQHHFITRYQAHGSPANILDLYSLATIPETEAFGSSNFPIPLLRVDQDYPLSKGRPSPLMMKFASSEAEVSGKHLVSSETGTWLANHFKVSLSQAKPQVDELWTAGINHIFFHGTTYSPQAEKYPGWLFYASTNWGPTSHFYNEFPFLTKYIFNSQSILQTSKPDNDVLVYFPIQDVWGDIKTADKSVHQLDVHHSDTWFMEHRFGKLSSDLWHNGFSFDYISDRQINALKVVGNKLQTAGGTYKVLVIPYTPYLPKATMNRLLALGKQGATIIFDQNMPDNPMGYGNFKENSAAFEKVKAVMNADKAHFFVAKDMNAELLRHKVLKEMIAPEGLSFIRKKRDGKTVYFISNLNNKFSEGWVTLSSGNYTHFTGYDPLTNKKFNFARNAKGQIYLSLLPSQSCFVLEGAAVAPAASAPRNYQDFAVNTSWELQFLGGRPNYHKTFKLDGLKSWTSLSDTAAFYTGPAKYTGYVNIPANVVAKKDVVIDLGTVNESARLTINGKYVGTAWSIPFRLSIPQNVLVAGKNKFEIIATNLSSNYMRKYDTEHPEWKKFYDINMADITYTPFHANKWAIMPSGLSTNNMKILYR